MARDIMEYVVSVALVTGAVALSYCLFAALAR
jgi:hypothetical protein